MGKHRVNISLEGDTLDRLDQYACEQHKTRSQAITDLVWQAKVKYEQLRGQYTISDLLSKPGQERKESRK
jgi:metal-responsive CopG/Arc/MetJ family transcriptional regulator